MQFVKKSRFFLIEIGKALPFVVCGLALLSYMENLYALYYEQYLIINDVVVLNKPISYFIGSYFEYNVQTLLVLCVISIATETCLYNKIACLYLGVNLYEKYYFTQHVYDNEIYYIVCIANILASGYLVYKGTKQVLK